MIQGEFSLKLNNIKLPSTCRHIQVLMIGKYKNTRSVGHYACISKSISIIKYNYLVLKRAIHSTFTPQKIVHEAGLSWEKKPTHSSLFVLETVSSLSLGRPLL